MEIRGQLKALHYFRKLITGETQNILPYKAVPLKTKTTQKLGTKFERCLPHKVGINSGDITNYLKILNNRKGANVHSVQIIKNGKMICDASFAPYSTENFHISHSLCKTLTGIAIGMLIDDGVLHYDDLLCDIFADKCTFLTSKRMKSVNISHLLSMTSGANFKEVSNVVETDWVSAFISYDVNFEPGSKFDYNSMNSYMLSAIVTKLTNKTLYDFLNERLFTPLNFGSIEWESCPMGITKGGWGMYILSEDAAKVGMLILNKGSFTQNGKTTQIISEKYIENACKAHAQFTKGQAYGFHIWIMEGGDCLVMNGLFGQNVFVFPKHDMIIAINSGGYSLSVAGPVYNITKLFLQNVANSKKETLINTLTQNYIQKNIVKTLKYNTIIDKNLNKLPEFLPKIIKDSNKTNEQVKQKCEMLDNSKYTFTKCRFGLLPIIMSCMNDFYTTGLTAIEFSYNRQTDTLFLIWTEAQASLQIPIGLVNPKICTLDFGGNKFKCAICGRFTYDEDDNMVLKVSVYFIESSSVQNLKFYFDEKAIKIAMNETPDFIDIIEHLRKAYPFAIGKDMLNFYQNEYAQKIMHRLCNISINGVKSE